MLYGAPLRSVNSTYPVVVVSHGMTGMRTVHTALCSELASHGYVLACVEHRDRSACTTVRKISGAPGEYEDEWISFIPFKGKWLKDLTQVNFRNKQVRMIYGSTPASSVFFDRVGKTESR